MKISTTNVGGTDAQRRCSAPPSRPLAAQCAAGADDGLAPGAPGGALASSAAAPARLGLRATRSGAATASPASPAAEARAQDRGRALVPAQGPSQGAAWPADP